MKDPVKDIVALLEGAGITAFADAKPRLLKRLDGCVVVSESTREYLTTAAATGQANKAILSVECWAKERDRVMEIAGTTLRALQGKGLISVSGGASSWDSGNGFFHYAYSIKWRL